MEFKYAEPRHVTNVDECFFYHHMDLPGLKEAGKGWDLRKTIDDRNGYWLAHRLLKSRARVYYGDIYNIPDEIGQFDVVLLGMVLPHSREPFYALAQTARLSRGVVIITRQAPKDQAPIAYFIPTPG
jgi:hypothetical protein